MKITYSSGLLTFHIFYDKRGVNKLERAPASALLLAAFISTLAGTYSRSAVANYLCGVKAWHTIHSLNWAFGETETEALLKSATTLALQTSKHPPREPYTIETVALIHSKLNLAISLDAAIFVCLTTLFYATACTGEFTTCTLLSFNPKMHIKLSDMHDVQDRQGNMVKNFHLPYMKSMPNGEDVNWAKQVGLFDPSSMFDNHLEVNNPPPNSPLFAYKQGRGYHALTKSKFIKTLNAALKAEGRVPLQSHGIHIGSTLEYLLRNIPFDVVKVKGRWASNAFLLYLQQHAQILAPYMQAQPELHASLHHLTHPPIH